MQKPNVPDVTNSFEFHRQHPEVLIDSYVKAKALELWESIRETEKLYLDKRFWVLLRDVHLGRSTKPAVVQLLSEIRHAVENDKILCPISESVFLELLKQQDLKTRQATAELIDEFSHGVTLVPYEQRVAQELVGIIAKFAPNNTEYHKPQNLVWSKLSFVLGVVHPSETAFDPTDELVLQKAFFDYMWQISLVEMIGFLENDDDFQLDTFEATADRLNELNCQPQSEVNSFKQVYLDEFRGALSLFMHIPRMWSESEQAKLFGASSAYSNEQNLDREQKWHTIFGNLITKKAAALMLPSLHIPALCHAAVRWNKGRKLAPNDFYDFHHAAAAVGYCSAFMTENPLKTMLQQKHLGLAMDFPCAVISDVDEAVDWVKDRVGG